MCLPAAALPVMAIASSVVSAAGSVYGGLQANAQGKYESKLAKRNAAAEVEAEREERRLGEDEARKYYRELSHAKGQNIAAMAANGVDVNFGSAERLQQDTEMLGDEDVTAIYRNTEQRRKGRLINAANFVEEAKAAKSRGKAALVGSMFSAAGSLMSGASQASKLRTKMGS
jgi:hypothetical protein